MCLTVQPGKPGSHKDIWMGFIEEIVKNINEINPTCIYVLWGRKAERIMKCLNSKNHVLTAPHPSGFSANKGFIGCNHFVEINNILMKEGKEPINWQI